MKKQLAMAAAAVWVCACGGPGRQAGGGIPEVELRWGEYPRKIVELDSADVRFVALETSDEYLVDNAYNSALDGNLFVVCNTVWDILVFDAETGKALSKFNHRGRGDQEYVSARSLHVDAKRGEIYVVSYDRVVVYDTEGNFLRSLPLPVANIRGMMLLGEDALVYYRDCSGIGWPEDRADSVRNLRPVQVISRTDGSLLREVVYGMNKGMTDWWIEKTEQGYIPQRWSLGPLARSGEKVLISDPAADTVFALTPSLELEPVLTRTPPVADMADPIYLNLWMRYKGYYLMVAYGVAGKKETSENYSYLHLDSRDGAVGKGPLWGVGGVFPNCFSGRYATDGRFFWSESAFSLKRKAEMGTISGRLGELVSALNEEDNGVLFILDPKPGAEQ